MPNRSVIAEKLREAAASVLPITAVVAVMSFLLIPVQTGIMLSFLLGAAMLILGMGLFTLGADMSMRRIGSAIGAKMTASRRLWLILLLSFVLGAAITMAEPDLQVLAANVPEIDTSVLIFTVSAGVGLFLTICMLRILFSISLRALLFICYALIFLLAAFVDPSVLPVAFDSGGVTTGPMTVPFIMSLGVGVASIRSDENAQADSFGLIALCSVGPILAVMALSFISHPEAQTASAQVIREIETTVELGGNYLFAIPTYLGEVALALLPVFVFFLLFQIFSLRLRRVPLVRVLLGVVFTYGGLVLFLTGANVGFSPLGALLGGELAAGELRFLLIPFAMVMGWFIINAEPAVHILNKQVEELSAGTISARAMGLSLSVAVSLAAGLSLLRVITGISILWFLLPGYGIALGLAFFVPRTFTAIAFDSGGVASGPLTATFLLPFAIGACSALGGDVMTEAFGLVALVAMMPLITVQIMGAIYLLRTGKQRQSPPVPEFGESEIIELWEAV